MMSCKAYPGSIRLECCTEHTLGQHVLPPGHRHWQGQALRLTSYASHPFATHPVIAVLLPALVAVHHPLYIQPE